MTVTRNARRQLQGIVSSTAMDKSIVVLTRRTFKHPKYGKFIRKQKKYMAHDPDNTAQRGDTVEIASTRPLSRHKRWRLVRIVERADEAALGELEATEQSSKDFGSEGGGS